MNDRKLPGLPRGSVYEIDGCKYVEDSNAEAIVGEYVVSLDPLGLVAQVVSITRDKQDRKIVGIRVEVPELAEGDEPLEFDLNPGDYVPLVPLVYDPCAWCGRDMSTSFQFDNERQILLRHKMCTKCGTIAYDHGTHYSWWNRDMMKFNPETKEILHNPNYIDDDDTEVMPY